MCSSARNNIRSPWPFLLLLLAWMGVNCQKGTILAVALAEDRSFSHQQRLTADVARVLATEAAPDLSVEFDNPLPAPVKPAVPPAPTIKEIQLVVEETVRFIAAGDSMTIAVATVSRLESILRAAPPHQPPRAMS